MTTINVKSDALCGNTSIPSGDYTVSVRADTRQINLAGHGRDIEIYAIGRRCKGVVRSMDVQFTPAGGASNWSLVVKTPKMGEFVSTLIYEEKKGRH